MEQRGLRTNVLVYDGPGVSSLQAAVVESLRAQLSDSYDVMAVDAATVGAAPWEATTALLVVPGGRDEAFLGALGQRDGGVGSISGIDRIAAFVRGGGRFLGVCAGAYFACESVHFDAKFASHGRGGDDDMGGDGGNIDMGDIRGNGGNGSLKVFGPRPLRFCPAVAVGSVSPAFVYDSETGAAAMQVDATGLDFDLEGANSNSSVANLYVNGGPFFDLSAADPADAALVTVLARYHSRIPPIHAARPGLVVADRPAIVECAVGNGRAILSGPHIEVSASYIQSRLAGISNTEERLHLAQVADRMRVTEHIRIRLFRSILARLGLRLNAAPVSLETTTALTQSDLDPSLQHITACFPTQDARKQFMERFIDVRLDEATRNPITTDTSQVETQTSLVDDSENQWAVALSGTHSLTSNHVPDSKRDSSLPPQPQPLIFVPVTPTELTHDTNDTTFSIMRYLSEFKSMRQSRHCPAPFGLPIMYSPVVTSTQTILEKNAKLRSCMPNGVVFVGSHQTQGRGRGRNSWISQAGCLQFSFKMSHRDASSVVFVQYLFGLAVVEAIESLPGCKDLGVRLKWPNDIYALTEDGMRKIGGILVTSEFQHGVFHMVVGCGLNVDNSKPTLCIRDLMRQKQQKQKMNDASSSPSISATTTETNHNLGPEIRHESVLAAIMYTFEMLYGLFAPDTGFGLYTHHQQQPSSSPPFAFKPFLEMYYRRWLHSDQKVRILVDGEPGEATILGLDRTGFLRARMSSDGSERLLQPDGNSFDMIKGLICSK